MLMNPCSMFSPFLCHNHAISHLHFVIMTFLLTVSPTLIPLLTHSLLLSIFLANWSVRHPALNLRYIIRIGCTDWVFFSFNIIGFSSPLLPCRLVDLRRGLIYSENLQHSPSLSSHSTTPSTDCTSAPDSPFDHLERSSRPTSTSMSLLLCD